MLLSKGCTDFQMVHPFGVSFDCWRIGTCCCHKGSSLMDNSTLYPGIVSPVLANSRIGSI